MFRSKGFYTAAFCFLLAAGVIATGFFRGQIKTKEPGSLTPGELDWANQGGSVIEPDEQVRAPVSGAPDERDKEDEQSEASTEETKPEKPKDFVLPLQTAILKDFSGGEMVRSKTMGDWRVHEGIDFTGEEGEAVKAVYDGKVTKVYEDILWGFVVEIDHGSGIVARYCGLNKEPLPKQEDTVAKGEQIGKLGIIPIEEKDGFHLHFEIRVNGKISDPLEVMGKFS